MNEQAAARIMQRIFSSQQQAFTNPETDEKTGEILGDSIKKLPQLARSIQKCQQSQVKLLITSPPYSNVTNYYYDQWLRLWLLGGPEYPGNMVIYMEESLATPNGIINYSTESSLGRNVSLRTTLLSTSEPTAESQLSIPHDLF